MDLKLSNPGTRMRFPASPFSLYCTETYKKQNKKTETSGNYCVLSCRGGSGKKYKQLILIHSAAIRPLKTKTSRNVLICIYNLIVWQRNTLCKETTFVHLTSRFTSEPNTGINIRHSKCKRKHLLMVFVPCPIAQTPINNRLRSGDARGNRYVEIIDRKRKPLSSKTHLLHKKRCTHSDYIWCAFQWSISSFPPIIHGNLLRQSPLKRLYIN